MSLLDPAFVVVHSPDEAVGRLAALHQQASGALSQALKRYLHSREKPTEEQRRQFRYPLQRAFLELPAGKIDPGEEILQTGIRELREETGHCASDWRYLGVMHPGVGYSNERIEIFLAEGLQKHESGQSLDHEEFLDVLTMSLDEAIEAVRTGDITDAKTVACLFWAEKILRAGW